MEKLQARIADQRVQMGGINNAAEKTLKVGARPGQRWRESLLCLVSSDAQ